MKKYKKIIPFLAFLLAFTMLSINLPVRSGAEETVQTTAAEDDRIPAETMPNPDADDGNDSEPPSDPTIEIGEISNSDTAELMGPPVITPTPDPTPETQITSGVYKLVNYGNSKVVDTESGGTTAGTRVQQWTDYGTTFNINQLFKITYLSTVNYVNYYSIRPMTNSGLGLCTPTANGNVTLEEMSTTESYSQIPTEMKWVISVYSSTAGTYTIRCVYSSTSSGYLSTGGSTTDGTQLVTEAYSSTANYQKWQLVPYTGDAIDDIGWYSFHDSLVVGQTVTYAGYVRSSTIDRNGPPTYHVDRDGGWAHNFATIDANTGKLTALKPGTITVGISYEGAPWIWLYEVEIRLEEGIVHTLVANNELIKPVTADNESSIEACAYSPNYSSCLWKIEYVGEYISIQNDVTGYYLTAPNNNNDLALITQTAYNASRSLWKLHITTGGQCRLQSKNQYERTTSMPLYLMINGYDLVQSYYDYSDLWDIKPLVMRLNVLYDQAFVNRFGSDYMNILQSVFCDNSIGVSIAEVFKNNFGISVKTNFSSISYQSYTYTQDCLHKNNLDTICLDCKNVGFNSDEEECQSGLHHKNEAKILFSLPENPLSTSTEVNILFTGFNTCNIKEKEEDGIISIKHQDYPTAHGLANLNHNQIEIIAYTRYSDLVSSASDKFDKIMRTTAHEILHTLGVVHCENEHSCIMKAQTYLPTVHLLMCDICRGTANANKINLYYHQ